jgi:hypothetical protein
VSVALLSFVRLLLIVASMRHWELFQMDIKNAFLNIWYTHPPYKVYWLRLVLFGLKDVSGFCLAKFSSTMLHIGFVSIFYDCALFIKRFDAGLIQKK